jgi:hypothetical protein
MIGWLIRAAYIIMWGRYYRKRSTYYEMAGIRPPR